MCRAAGPSPLCELPRVRTDPSPPRVRAPVEIQIGGRRAQNLMAESLAAEIGGQTRVIPTVPARRFRCVRQYRACVRFGCRAAALISEFITVAEVSRTRWALRVERPSWLTV